MVIIWAVAFVDNQYFVEMFSTQYFIKEEKRCIPYQKGFSTQ